MGKDDPKKIYYNILKFRLRHDEVESLVSLTARVIIYYCLPAIGVFSNLYTIDGFVGPL